MLDLVEPGIAVTKASPPPRLPFMSGQTAKKYPEAGMQAAATVSAYMLKVARPLFWHIGVPNDGPLRGASTFIIQFEARHIAVTADHVIAQYLDARAADDRTICQIGECQVWPEGTIARSAKLDIATFEIDPSCPRWGLCPSIVARTGRHLKSMTATP
jgi:hypothetical protein